MAGGYPSRHFQRGRPIGYIRGVVTETWTDNFEDGVIDPLWTVKVPTGATSSVTESGGRLVIFCDGTTSTFWTAANKDFGAISVSLASIFSSTPGLYLIDSSFRYGSGPWVEFGLAYVQDLQNMFSGAIGNPGGFGSNDRYHKYFNANILAESTRLSHPSSGPPWNVDVRMLQYYNSHMTKTFSLSAGGTLAPQSTRGFVDYLGGSGWEAIGPALTAPVIGAVPVDVMLWAATSQPGFQAFGAFYDVTISHTNSSSGL